MIPGVLGAVASQNVDTEFKHIWKSGEYSGSMFTGLYLGDCAVNYTEDERRSMSIAPIYDMAELGLQRPSWNYLRAQTLNNDTVIQTADGVRYGLFNVYCTSPVNTDKYSQGTLTLQNMTNLSVYFELHAVKKQPLPGTSPFGYQRLFRIQSGDSWAAGVTLGSHSTKTYILKRSDNYTSGIWYPSIDFAINNSSGQIGDRDIRVLEWTLQR